jgi:serine/threonine protein kinase
MSQRFVATKHARRTPASEHRASSAWTDLARTSVLRHGVHRRFAHRYRFCDRERLPLDARLELCRDACSAVHFAHQRLVVHRDLKPGNVLVARDPNGKPAVKLVDFGISS